MSTTQTLCSILLPHPLPVSQLDSGGKGISLGMPELSQQELWRQFVAGLVVSRITNSSNVSLSAERPCLSLTNGVQTYPPSESYMSP